MTYTIAKEFKIINDEDGWSFDLTESDLLDLADAILKL